MHRASDKRSPEKGSSQSRRKWIGLGFAAAALAVLAPLPAAASGGIKCDDIATNYPTSKAKSDKGNSPWKLLQSITSRVVPQSGANAAYCLVDLKYVREINIRVGLPLSSADGGTGGIRGAWNGKLRNLGGGGTVGSLSSVTPATNTGYVGSFTDSGHNNAFCNANGHPNCDPGGYGFVLDANNNLLEWQLDDFVYISIIEQVRWAKRLAEFYYGVAPTRNYWDGCSTGGRQGMEMAQRYGDEFDGILAGAPAINWSRFQMGSLWIGTVLNDHFSTAGMSTAKINAANTAAIAACDANDGVVDGIINEPRRCMFSAQALKCTGTPGEPATCLTQAEADAVDKVWDGARNQAGQRLWGGPTKGTSWSTLSTGPAGRLNQPANIPVGFVKSVVEENPAWSYTSLTLQNFGTYFQKEDVKVGHLAGDNPVLDNFKNKGGKLITWHGGSDPLILPYGSWEYWGRVFDQYGGPANTDSFFRAFYFPGVGHCGGGAAPQPPGMFDVLVNWVENGVAPDHLVATQNLGGGVTRTRKVCRYPNEAVYTGSGSTDDQANFQCVVNSKVPADLADYMVSAPRFKQAP